MNKMYKLNAEQIKSIIKSQGRTGKGVATLIGMEASTWRSKLATQITDYGFYEKEIVRICDVLGINIDSLEKREC